MILPLDQPTDESNPGHDSIRHRYIIEDVREELLAYLNEGVYQR